jgi:hypothetical protein
VPRHAVRQLAPPTRRRDRAKKRFTDRDTRGHGHGHGHRPHRDDQYPSPRIPGSPEAVTLGGSDRHRRSPAMVGGRVLGDMSSWQVKGSFGCAAASVIVRLWWEWWSALCRRWQRADCAGRGPPAEALESRPDGRCRDRGGMRAARLGGRPCPGRRRRGSIRARCRRSRRSRADDVPAAMFRCWVDVAAGRCDVYADVRPRARRRAYKLRRRVATRCTERADGTGDIGPV